MCLEGLNMFKKILVALDISPEAAAIFEFALSIAQTNKSEILVLHIVEWQIQDVYPWMGCGTLYDVDISGNRYEWSRKNLSKVVEKNLNWLATFREQAQTLDIKCECECRVGSCNLGIGDRAKEWGADLIVIGRRGHKNISEVILGSVSNYVIHHAPCSVIVVQGSKVSEAEKWSDVAEV